jgi:SAM-dependent methyltransferase
VGFSLDRKSFLLKHIDLSLPGIEVAPYFNPAVAKRDGYPVLTLDVFDSKTLRENAAQDPHIPAARIDEIEDVDIVADACSIGEAVARIGRTGQFRYILSSHNFEHLPDPIRFLQGCSAALAPGGVVSMAVPDGRACFDHFRMPTRLSDWLSAYHRKLEQPAPETIFDSRANFAEYYRYGAAQTGCDITFDDPRGFRLRNDLRQSYAEYQERLRTPQDYLDAHCTVTFGAALENMLWDLRFLGLIDLEVVEVTGTQGLEFYVHLRKPETSSRLDEAAFYAARSLRQRLIADTLGSAGFGRPGPGLSRWDVSRIRVGRSAKALFAGLLSQETYARIRAWNSRRKSRRS